MLSPVLAFPARPGAASLSTRQAVPGGRAILLAVQAGGRLALTDPEGGQAALLFAADPALLAAPPPRAEGIGLAALLEDDGAAAAGLAALGLTPGQFHAFSIAAGDAPGLLWESVLTAAGVLVVAAPGAPMMPDEQNPPTALLADYVAPAPLLGVAPPPLARVKAEWRIDAATARAYRVARGDYIQIIDVDGKQCSDFLAFDAAALAQGREHGLDATATRTLLGAAFATPGLHAKYFDDRLQPLVEVIRDTVGRHDTFQFACTPKYYEDMGYPGHVSCTANFNAALADLGVAPRAGWQAINFFYNTQVNADNSISMDEPWSRPGDYVLLRALTDLVCASSACPDDIDPANGWLPTDIHVRIHDAAETFSKGIARRMTPDSPPQLTRETAFHPRLAALTRNLVEYRGFWLPACFANEGPIAEYWACREKAVVIDLSPLRKFEILGPDAETLMQWALTRDVKKLAVGQVVYTAICHEHGGMLDDGTLFRLGQFNFRLVCGDDYVGPWLRQLAADKGLNARVKSSTDQMHNIAVQGPLSRRILADLVATPPHQPSLAELKWFRFTIGRIAGAPVLVSRTGYTGELGYEIWCHPMHALAVWDAVWAAGQPLGMTPLGLSALDMVRIEAGLVFGGHDFCDQTDPFEAGIGFAAPASKSDPFIGGEALARRRDHPARRMVGLDIDGNEPVGHGDPVFAGRARVGQITSAVKSPILGKQIALARIDVAAGGMGAALEIGKLDGQQKRIAARIVRFPHFDPDKTRVRA